jgi:hypothetical protein
MSRPAARALGWVMTSGRIHRSDGGANQAPFGPIPVTFASLFLAGGLLARTIPCLIRADNGGFRP